MSPTFRFDRLLGALRHPVTEYRASRAKSNHRYLHPCCLACGCPSDPVTGKQNEVHHVVPGHVDPALAAEKTNLATLCRMHHYLVGHLRDWKKFNRAVVDDAQELYGKYTDMMLIGNEKE